jgi:hypothetical protein
VTNRHSPRSLDRRQLAGRLGASLATVDRLIAAGLASVGMRGQAKLYGLADARRLLARRRAPGDPAAEQAKRQDYLSHAEDLDDRRRHLEREWIASGTWRPLWRRCVAALERLTRAWPRRLAERVAAVTADELPRLLRADGPWVDPPAPWPALLAQQGITLDEWRARQPGRPAPVMRPLLEALAAAVEADPAHRALFGALATPRPAAAASAPTTTAAGRARWREARAAFRSARVAVRRGHDRRADVHAQVLAAIEESRLVWERWPGHMLHAAGDPAAALAAGHRLREEALAPLRRLAGAEEVAR